MKSPDQADSGGDWRVQLSEMRTLAALRAEAPAREAAERLTDRVLIAAAQNPDHSEAGRAAAADAARARNVTVTPWRVRVPSFLSAHDLAKGQRLFFGWGRRVRVWSGALAAIGGAFFIFSFGWLLVEMLAFDAGAVTSGGGLWIDPLLIGVVAALLTPTLIWLCASLFRGKPARVCVLAPPQSDLTRAPLRRFVRKELRAFGHVMLHAPDGPIRTASAYRTAASLMANKLAMNLRAARPNGVALRIGGSPAWAPLTRAMGAESADCVVVDLSGDAGEALAQIADPRRCVFVALWGKLEAAEAALAARGIAAAVHHYAPDGEIQRRPAFRAAMLAAMAA